MPRTQPPFRADHVGSLLRTPALKEARAQYAAGTMSAAELTATEDREILSLIASQEAVGLRSVTDGEFRRSYWHFDFLEQLCGVERVQTAHGIQFQGGVESPRKGLRITGKLDFPDDHPFLDHFRFLQRHTNRTAKMTLPSPSVLHFRAGRAAASTEAYPEMQEFFHDLGEAYHKAVQAFANAGCRYLQLDEVNFTYLCDKDQRAMLAARGDDPDKLPEIYAGLINRAISGRPTDMVITTHLCRGNFQSKLDCAGWI
jgi:5-methyltetrahydropteroyltriglutamate--homocysteine methyltransferase